MSGTLPDVDPAPDTSADSEPSLGARITAARKNAGLTQQQLADIIGISARAIGNIENDRAVPSTKNLAALERALHISLDGDTPPPGPDTTLPDLITALMAARDYPSTRALSRASGISNQSLAMVRQGRSLPEADSLRKLARALAGPDDIIDDIYDQLHYAAYRRGRSAYVPPEAAHDLTDRERGLVNELILTLVRNRAGNLTEQARAARAAQPDS